MTSNNSNSSNNPFGAARPREAVLASLGVDHRESDRKVDEKAFYHHPHQYHQDTKPAYVHQTPYFHQSFDKDDDDWTHDTASITTIHSHHTAPGDVSGGDPYMLMHHTANLVTQNHPTTPAVPAKPPFTTTHTNPKKKKIDPFGSARPREVVLANKGIDYRRVDKLVDRKIAAERLTPEQDAEAEIIRLALTKAEDSYWDANEQELPEEELRLEMESKRKELHDLLEKFQEMNLQKQKREESSASRKEATKDGVDDNEKAKYNFQGRTRGYQETSYRRSSPSPNEKREEYHGGDARRYNNAEHPSHASQNRDGDEEGGCIRPRYESSRYNSCNYTGGRGYHHQGGRGRGGRGRRGGGRGSRGQGGYVGHGVSYGRRYYDHDEYKHRCERTEHWALMD